MQLSFGFCVILLPSLSLTDFMRSCRGIQRLFGLARYLPLISSNCLSEFPLRFIQFTKHLYSSVLPTFPSFITFLFHSHFLFYIVPFSSSYPYVITFVCASSSKVVCIFVVSLYSVSDVNHALLNSAKVKPTSSLISCIQNKVFQP